MKYEVFVTATIDKVVLVEAEDEWDAKDLAEEKVNQMLNSVKDVTSVEAWDACKYKEGE